MRVVGVAGYRSGKFDYEPAPRILAYVLSWLLENALRQSLILSGGSMQIFVTRPISAGCLVLAVVLLASSILPRIRARRKMLVEQAEEAK